MREKLSVNNQQFLSTYVFDSLLKEKDGYLPILYYNSCRFGNFEILPESYFASLRDIKKSSRLIEMPENFKRDYFGCVVYAKQEDFAYLNEIAGYSASKVEGLRYYNNIFNICKFNAYGESRPIDLIPFALIKKENFNEDRFSLFSRMIRRGLDISTYCIPVTRVINGEKNDFIEINFDLSNYYDAFCKDTRTKLFKEIYNALLNEYQNYNEIVLLRADGTDFFIDEKNVQNITKQLQSKSGNYAKNKMFQYAVQKGIVQLNCQGENLENIKQIEVPCENNLEWYKSFKVDEKYRIMLSYLNNSKNKQNISVYNIVKQYYKDSKLNITEIKQADKTILVNDICVSRQYELEFARVLPLIYKYCQTLKVLDEVEDLNYINYYGEYRDCSRTPFMLMNSQDKTAEIRQLTKELNKRYNYDFKILPINRIIQDQPQQVIELSLDWYANTDFNNGFISNFDKTIPILANLEKQAAINCEKKDIIYYPIYANGQLK